ncbi:MAG: sulfite exporter TauE/SafE family protein [Candidatus Fonsibacter ubiquis]|nr:sulfite exporter TauE/SafE family protein [Candidatus Fonsibacter ubiquis]
MNNKVFKILFGILVISAISLLTYYHETDKTSFNNDLFFWALLFGAVAALIDGSLGMAYGVTGTAFLLGYGISPVKAVAYIHIAEIFVSGSSGLNHWKIGNIDTKLFKKLLIPGIIGAILGALIIAKVKIPYLSIVISIYLLFMGIFLIAKAYSKIKLQFKQKNSVVIPLAVTGGFVDGAGGGGWGPVVTTSLLGGKMEPKKVIGTVNASEFFINLASAVSLLFLVKVTDWEALAGLIIGGFLVAPYAARVTSKMSVKMILTFVGVLITVISLRKII